MYVRPNDGRVVVPKRARREWEFDNPFGSGCFCKGDESVECGCVGQHGISRVEPAFDVSAERSGDFGRDLVSEFVGGGLARAGAFVFCIGQDGVRGDGFVEGVFVVNAFVVGKEQGWDADALPQDVNACGNVAAVEIDGASVGGFDSGGTLWIAVHLRSSFRLLIRPCDTQDIPFIV